MHTSAVRTRLALNDARDLGVRWRRLRREAGPAAAHSARRPIWEPAESLAGDLTERSDAGLPRAVQRGALDLGAHDRRERRPRRRDRSGASHPQRRLAARFEARPLRAGQGRERKLSRLSDERRDQSDSRSYAFRRQGAIRHRERRPAFSERDPDHVEQARPESSSTSTGSTSRRASRRSIRTIREASAAGRRTTTSSSAPRCRTIPTDRTRS